MYECKFPVSRPKLLLRFLTEFQRADWSLGWNRKVFTVIFIILEQTKSCLSFPVSPVSIPADISRLKTTGARTSRSQVSYRPTTTY